MIRLAVDAGRGAEGCDIEEEVRGVEHAAGCAEAAAGWSSAAGCGRPTAPLVPAAAVPPVATGSPGGGPKETRAKGVSARRCPPAAGFDARAAVRKARSWSNSSPSIAPSSDNRHGVRAAKRKTACSARVRAARKAATRRALAAE